MPAAEAGLEKGDVVLDFNGKPALLVMFICNHCPFVKHIADELSSLGREYQDKGAGAPEYLKRTGILRAIACTVLS